MSCIRGTGFFIIASVKFNDCSVSLSDCSCISYDSSRILHFRRQALPSIQARCISPAIGPRNQVLGFVIHDIISGTTKSLIGWMRRYEIKSISILVFVCTCTLPKVARKNEPFWDSSSGN